MLAVERNYSVAEDQVEKQRYQRRNEDGLSELSDELGMMRLGDCYLNKIPKGTHGQPRTEALRVKSRKTSFVSDCMKTGVWRFRACSRSYRKDVQSSRTLRHPSWAQRVQVRRLHRLSIAALICCRLPPSRASAKTREVSRRSMMVAKAS